MTNDEMPALPPSDDDREELDREGLTPGERDLGLHDDGGRVLALLGEGSGRARRRRPRGELTSILKPRFTAAERAEVEAAAAAAGMSTARFCAEAVVAVARGLQPTRLASEAERAGWARLQQQLFLTRTAIVRFATNVNQAVTALNATGRAPVWLESAVTLTARSVARVDAVIAEVDRRLR